jgi:low temperature requirement protein LtrA
MRIVRAGLPLALVLGLAAALLAVATVAREISARAGFLVERQAVLLVWLVGLLLAAALIAWVSRAALRRADSSASLWLLVLTAVALASPLLLALQQHPSP